MLSLLLAQLLAVRGAELVDPRTDAPARAVTVIVEGERIREVGEGAAVPAGAREIDGRGLFLCAAPIDGFAYWNADHDPLYAAAGVGLVADHGNRLLTILDARASTGRAGFPALHVAGSVIDGFPPSTNDASVARTPAEAQGQLEALLGENVDFVAFQSNLPADAWRKLLELAHAKDKLVWGPLPRGVALGEAVVAGQDGILFLDAVLPAGKAWDAAALADFAPQLEALGAARTRMVPLLASNARLIAEWSAAAPELEWLSPEFAHVWKSELAARSAAFKDPAARQSFLDRGAKVLELQRALLAKLHAAGVRLVPGSGAPHPWLLPGQGLHDELALWQQSGLPARAVLRAATSGAADALGVGDQRGSVEVGKLADLVLLRADPSRDVAALRDPAWVIVRGHASSRAELDAALAALRERQMRAQADALRPIEVGDPPKVEGELVLAGYCETQALGVRSAAERYTVVRSKDGALSFCGRRVIPQADGSRIEVESEARVSAGTLEHFLVRVMSAKHQLSVEGFWTASQMRVERRVDGGHIDVRTAKERISAVDAGSVTTLLLIAATQDGGPFHVMSFHESLELEVVRWDLRLEPDGAHFLRTPEGVKWARFDARGGLLELSEQRGSSGVRTTGTNTLAKDRAGLPFSAAKLEAIEKARAEAEAARAEAAKGAPEPPAKKPSGERGG